MLTSEFENSPVHDMIASHLTPIHYNLQRLLIIRSLFATALMTGLAISFFALNIELPYLTLLGLITALTLWNAISWFWLFRSADVSLAYQSLLQIIVDLAFVTTLLYFTGGANNPFVAYYLVPLSLAASFLPQRYAFTLLALSVLLYSSLFIFYQPLAEVSPVQHHHSQPAGFNAHSLGMWLNFVFSAFLITLFVGQMASTMRQQDAHLSSLREENLRDEQIMAVATLAAGTAHELATPLSSIKTLVNEMKLDYQQPELQQDLAILSHQINHCTGTLQRLHQQTERNRLQPSAENLTHYCQRLFDSWLLLHPQVSAKLSIVPDCPDITARLEPTIEQSISNLLNNAADASAHNIQVHCHWTLSCLFWQIDDNGPGVEPGLREQLGTPYSSSKGRGRGLGLFLTNATLTRFGGEVRLLPRAEGGTRTELSLPLTGVETA